MIIKTFPVVFPVVKALGYDPIWFGVIVTMLIEIAMISPPDGTVMYVLQGMRRRGGPITDVFLGSCLSWASTLSPYSFCWRFRNWHCSSFRAEPRRSARPIGGEEGLHRDADDVAYPLLHRRLAEIEQHRLEQGRLTRIDELRGRDLAIIDGERAGPDLILEIAGQKRDSMGRTGFIK